MIDVTYSRGGGDCNSHHRDDLYSYIVIIKILSFSQIELLPLLVYRLAFFHFLVILGSQIAPFLIPRNVFLIFWLCRKSARNVFFISTSIVMSVTYSKILNMSLYNVATVMTRVKYIQFIWTTSRKVCLADLLRRFFPISFLIVWNTRIIWKFVTHLVLYHCHSS